MPVIDNVILSNKEKEEIKKLCMDLVLNCVSEKDAFAHQKIEQLIDRIGEFVWIAFELGKDQNIPR